MGRALNVCKMMVLGGLALGIACATQAAEVPTLAPLNLHAQYTIRWGGITIGRVNVESTEDDFGYHLSIDTKTKGLTRLISDEKTVSEVKGHFSPTGDYLPLTYSSNRNKADAGFTKLTWDAEGKLAKREREPDDDPTWRPPVSTELANTATDTISAGLALRKKMHDHMAKDIRETTVRSYDGARLAELTFKVVSKARVEVDNDYYDAINVVVTRKPILGYTPKELKKFEAGDPVIHLYFSADEKMIPLKATAAIAYGEISASLLKK